MAPNPSPAIQGELDALCGVYSVVNAVQWALHTGSAAANFGQVKPLTSFERQTLFDELVMALGKRRPLAKFVTGGISSLELTRLLHIARDWVFAHRSAELVPRRPFYGRRKVAKRQVISLLTKHLAMPRSAAIISVEWTLPHWTVATGLSRKRIRLFDSGYGVFITLKSISYRGPGRPNGMKPGNIFLLRLSLETGIQAEWS